MLEIIVDNNISGQRLDRFIRKFLDKASLGFIYAQIRKKNIVVNDKKSKETYILKNGDSIKIYFSDETIEKFRTNSIQKPSSLELDIIYEDENIALINKASGVLSHSNGKDNIPNIVDGFINYLIDKKEYLPEENPTFSPSLCNRLDRNTSGLIIGAKNYEALKSINKAQRQGMIKKYYHTIVRGDITSNKLLEGNLIKDEEDNKVYLIDNQKGKHIKTYISPILSNGKFTLLEVDLLTGRTHQIRVHLESIKSPIIGDNKYGDTDINQYFRRKYKLNHQLLHCEKVMFDGLLGNMEYLNHMTFEAKKPKVFREIIEGEFYGK